MLFVTQLHFTGSCLCNVWQTKYDDLHHSDLLVFFFTSPPPTVGDCKTEAKSALSVLFARTQIESARLACFRYISHLYAIRLVLKGAALFIAGKCSCKVLRHRCSRSVAYRVLCRCSDDVNRKPVDPAEPMEAQRRVTWRWFCGSVRGVAAYCRFLLYLSPEVGAPTGSSGVWYWEDWSRLSASDVFVFFCTVGCATCRQSAVAGFLFKKKKNCIS